MIHTESFRWCRGYEGSYEVGNFGTVRSVNKLSPRSDTGKLVSYAGKVLKQMKDRRGYVNVHLSSGGKSKRFRVHRLVADAFVDNPSYPLTWQVNHKDGDKSNNVYTNLEWVTNEENMKHAVENNLKAEMRFGSLSTSFTGSVEAYKAGTLVAIMSGNEEMRSLGFDYRLVSAVLHGKRKTHKGCTFVKLERVYND